MIYQYYTLFRPPMLGGIPRGAVAVEEFEHPLVLAGKGHAHGIVSYSRKLNEKEIADYELVAIDNISI